MVSLDGSVNFIHSRSSSSGSRGSSSLVTESVTWVRFHLSRLPGFQFPSFRSLFLGFVRLGFSWKVGVSEGNVRLPLSSLNLLLLWCDSFPSVNQRKQEGTEVEGWKHLSESKHEQWMNGPSARRRARTQPTELVSELVALTSVFVRTTNPISCETYVRLWY